MNSNFSLFERFLARGLGHFPFLKRITKAVYSRVIYLLYMSSKCRSSLGPACQVLNDDLENFFGYYDKSPVNSIGSVICCRSPYDTRQIPSKNQLIFLSVYLENEIVPCLNIPLNAYNWQQGARAQWISNDNFIFNKYDDIDNRYIAIVYSVKTGSEVKRFELPVQDAFRSDYFLSINYSRVMSVRPDYGYRNLEGLASEQLHNLEDDGIWRVDYDTGRMKLIKTLESICQIKKQKLFSECFHEINHIMISPNGQFAIFIHRYYYKKRRFDRLFLLDIKSEKLKLLADNEMVSHCCWVDTKTIFGYLRGPGGLDGYWLIDCVTGEFSRFSNHLLEMYGDGHPHCLGNKFVTDSYPDKSRMQHLFWGDLKTGEVIELGCYKHGFDFSGECRCDLHPRLSPDGKRVYFDSVFSGKRQLYYQDISG